MHDSLLQKLQEGCIYRAKRWAGDNFQELSSGQIDEDATDDIMLDAYRVIVWLLEKDKKVLEELAQIRNNWFLFMNQLEEINSIVQDLARENAKLKAQNEFLNASLEHVVNFR